MSRVVIVYALSVPTTYTPGNLVELPRQAAAEEKRLEIDATLTIVHSKAAEATQVPVETGATISDHVLLRPDQVKLEGIISNAPLRSSLQPVPGEEEFGANAEAGLYLTRGTEARAILAAIHELREPVTIYAGAQVFENMVMQGLEVPEESATGDALKFSASFVQIRTAESKTADVPKVLLGKVSKGKKATEKADAALSGRVDSMAKSMINPSGNALVPSISPLQQIRSLPSH